MAFQPFLRFYRSCWAVFWVFKFFGSFLEPRRPLSNSALRSKMTALGRGGAPFFAVAQRSSGWEGGKGAPFFAVLSADRMRSWGCNSLGGSAERQSGGLGRRSSAGSKAAFSPTRSPRRPRLNFYVKPKRRRLKPRFPQSLCIIYLS